MNKSELIKLLKKINIPTSHYSLDGELLSDRMIIYNSYEKWIVFYLDERGNRNEEKEFDSESKALSYLYERFKELKDLGAY